MKLLKSWICICVATAFQSAFAQDDFNAYRLGDYMHASTALAANQDKTGVADYYRGRMYLYGYGQLKNDNVALRYLTKSADKGFLPAQQLIARYTLLKENDPARAFIWFKKAAEAGDISAKMYVAAAYLFGVGVNKNEDKARQYYIDAAKSGNPIAQYTLAKYFLDSRQLVNKKLGLIWLNKSVQAGNPRAQTEMAMLHLSGKLVPQDSVIADKLLKQAVAKNFPLAMMRLGNIALEHKAYQAAQSWFQKASALGYYPAEFALAKLYLTESTPIYNQQTGYLAMLKLAQSGYIPAMRGVAVLYEKGIGVAADKNIADQWVEKIKKEQIAKAKSSHLDLAARWLSNGYIQNMADTNYQLGGIFSAWKNANALKENNYNPAPQREQVSRQALFKPAFELILPNEVAISTYYDALVNTFQANKENTWNYPSYALNPQIVDLQHSFSLILQPHHQILPYRDNYALAKENQATLDLLNFNNVNVDEILNYAAVVNQLEQRAILGDAEAQFDLGQLYQYGIGVPKDENQAVLFYQNAVDQQHEGAEYNLGVLYLKKEDSADAKKGQDLLLNAAFKGNKYAQYALANLLTQTEKDQAISMQYLAAANGYGLAQYALAEYLVRDKGGDLSVPAQAEKTKRIRSLYASAAKQGIAEALLPLAFYNAMDSNKNLQGQAFTVALQEAQKGDSKAALLAGLLYDRGIGVAQDSAKALYWYQQAGNSPVRNFIVGTYTSAGQGITLDKDRGKALLTKSADSQFSYAYLNLGVLANQTGQAFLPDLVDAYQLGNSRAGILLADYYLSKNNDDKKMQEAKDIYWGLAQKGDPNAQLKLAYMFAEGLGSKPDWLMAEQWYTLAADQGNPTAQYLLGELYQRGSLGEPDYPAAIAWYEKAAKQLSKASVALGFLYETVFDDYPKALKAYEQAANQGDVLGLYNLGLMLEEGKGIPEDFAKAGNLYEQAAKKGFSPAMTQLAGLYFSGLGKAKDEQQALFWYKKAAELGNANALYELGLLSETGIATQIAFTNALNYYQQAADKGNEKAMLALARMYNYGLGVVKDKNLALRYYQTLANKNNAYAQFQLAKQYLAENNSKESTEKGHELLEKASENGNVQASLILQRMEAESENKVSYLEPVIINPLTSMALSPDIMYFNALNAWNRGDETLSRLMINQIMHAYPNYVPAQKAYEQLKA